MPTIIQTFQGRVTGIWGTAHMRGADGRMHPLKLGELVHKGDVILTTQNGIVQLSPEDSPTATALMTRLARPESAAQPELDRVISALNEPDSRAATAAGVSGGDGGGDLGPGLRVDRIAEAVTPASLIPPAIADGLRQEQVAGGQVVEPPHPDIDAGSNIIDATEEGPAVGLGLQPPTGTTPAAVITVTQIPVIGVLKKADGTAVTIGSALTPAELAGLKYVPPADYNGTAQVGEFSYTVTEGGATATGNVGIVLTPVNDAPIAAPDIGAGPEDTPQTGNVLSNDRDVDGPSLQVTQYTIAGVTHPAGTPTNIVGVGTVVINADGAYTFTPAPDYNGPVPAIGYTISDGSLTSTSTLTLTVTPVNDPPDAIDDFTSTPINTPVTVPVLGNDRDRDGDALTVTTAVLADPGQGSLTVNPDGTLTFTPATNLVGPVLINYTVSDGHGGTDTAVVTINVGTNNPPAGADSTHTIAEDTSYTVNIADFGFSDADAGQTLANVRVDSVPAIGTLTLNGVAVVPGAVVAAAEIAAGHLVFTPLANGNGAPYAAFTFSVQDSAGSYDLAPNTLTLNVSPINDTPVAQNDSGTGAEDTLQSGNVLTNDSDVDGNTLSVTQFVVAGSTFTAGATATLAGVGALLVNADGSYTFTPVADYHGPVPVATCTVSDGTVTTTSTLTLAVTAVADIVNDSVNVVEDTPTTFNPITGAGEVGGADNFENTGRILTAVGTPLHGTVTFNGDGTIVYTPTANYNGPDSFSYTVTSGGTTETATINITVGAVDDVPTIAVPPAQSTTEDTSKTIIGVAVGDVDSTNLTTTLTVAHGTLAITAGSGATIGGAGTGTVTLSGTAAQINAALATITYNPSADYNGADALNVSTTDGTGTTTTSVALTVSPVADVVDDTVTGTEDTPITFNPITGSGEVGGADNFESVGRILTSVGTPQHGTVTFAADGTIVYTPSANYNGPDSFQYTVTSGGVTETATINIIVAAVNDAAVPTLAVTPVGRWTFDESSGTTTRDAYNAQAGTLSDDSPTPPAVPTWTTGHTGTSGTALHFDGTGSFVALPTAATTPLLSTSSLTFWIKTAQTGSSAGWDAPGVISSEQNGGGNDIQWGTLNENGQIGFHLGNVPGVYSTTAINDNAWHAVAITRDAASGLVNVYVDGALEASGSPSDPKFTGLLDRLAGFGTTNVFANDAAGTDQPDNFFLNADLDDVRIYDHVLTSDQVAAIKAVESGHHDLAVANDGDAIRLAIAASDYTGLTVSGLNSGMVISDGAGGHTATIGAAGVDSVVDLTGWTLGSLSVSGAGTGSATLEFNATNTVADESHSTTQYLNIVNGSSLLGGGVGNDTLTGTAGADLLVGDAGNDALNAGAGNDRLIGGTGNDALNGGADHDVLTGGAGNDTLTGGSGADTFSWTLADRGTGGAPAADAITDFNVAAVAAGGDTLDLRDLLVGANHVGTDPGNLEKYLDFDTTSTPGSTIIRVSSSGGFAGGTYAAGSEDERITLQGVDLRASFGLAAAASDSQVIQELLTRSKLVTDGH